MWNKENAYKYPTKYILNMSTSIQTRSVTSRMLHEEKMKQEKIQCIQHYKLLESTYDKDFQAFCDIEEQCYIEIEELKNKIEMLFHTINHARNTFDVKYKPYRQLI